MRCHLRRRATSPSLSAFNTPVILLISTLAYIGVIYSGVKKILSYAYTGNTPRARPLLNLAASDDLALYRSVIVGAGATNCPRLTGRALEFASVLRKMRKHPRGMHRRQRRRGCNPQYLTCSGRPVLTTPRYFDKCFIFPLRRNF